MGKKIIIDTDPVQFRPLEIELLGTNSICV